MTTPVIPAAAVEAAARAICAEDLGEAWEDAEPNMREVYEVMAQAALSAAYPVIVEAIAGAGTSDLQNAIDAMVGEMHELLNDCDQTNDPLATVHVWAVREVLAKYRVTTDQTDGTDWAAVARAQREIDAAAINRYDEICNGEPYPPGEQWTADDICHKWAVRVTEETCRARLEDESPVTEQTPGAFPITTLWNAR